MNPHRVALLLLTAALLVPAAAHGAGRIAADAAADPGEPFVVFERGTGENQVGLHLEPGGDVPFGLFNGPASFAVHDGIVHLLDTLNRRILRASKGGPIGQTALPKEMLGVDLTLAGSDYLVLDGAGPQAVKFSTAGKELLRFGGPGDAPGLFRQVDQAGIDASGEILVLDWGVGGVVSRFSPEGRFLDRERAGTTVFTDPTGKRLRVEFHADTGDFVLFRGTRDGETEDALFKMEGQKSGANLDVVGVDGRGRVYLKRFRPPEAEVLRLDPTGKTESRHPAPADPGFDAVRHYAVDPVSGEVYCLVCRDAKVVVLRLPAASARAN